ncbi:hypothetical protein, partial [Limnobacter sp. CACIAM 66H1]|uniref:hypothetical protein n=1 Tax=Limnobacter sp. CACIAM 66H1 TaxID=1813033 RepID=UPI0025BCB1D4
STRTMRSIRQTGQRLGRSDRLRASGWSGIFSPAAEIRLEISWQSLYQPLTKRDGKTGSQKPL